MNERIRLLAEQAQKVAYYADGGYTPIMTLDQEKFAELIVRECVGIVKFTPTGVPHATIIKIIKEHFGVEE
jgi:hypothetical protein